MIKRFQYFGTNFNSKKAISPVVAVALLLVIAVVAVVGFQGWFSSFSSNIFADVETKSDKSLNFFSIETIVGNSLYLKNSANEDVVINSIKINGEDCAFVKNISSGIEEVDVSSCLSLAERSFAEVVITTTEGIVEKTIFLRNLPTSDSLLSDIWVEINATGEPQGRRYPVAGYTSGYACFWGGNVGSNVNTGGCYDVSSMLWQTMNTSGAPSARTWHRGVASSVEDKFCVFGGFGGSAALGTGGCYDISDDSWVFMNATNRPSARFWSHIVYASTTDEVCVWGGLPNSSSELNDGGCYDISDDSWRTINSTNAPPGRANAAFAWTGEEMCVWGGEQPSNGWTKINTGGCYNPQTDIWATMTTINSPEAAVGSVGVWASTTNEFCIWGGRGNSDENLISEGKCYTPSSDSWRNMSLDGNPPSARKDMQASWTGEEMCIWGGQITGDSDVLNTGNCYNPQADLWRNMSNTDAPSKRYQHGQVAAGSQVCIWGGYSGSGNLANGSCFYP
ncbi:MAG: Kelch repeat-containing protein [Nanoarchaeota archaeon]